MVETLIKTIYNRNLLKHATTLGYDWNTACDFLDDMRLQYEIHKLEFEASKFVKNTEKMNIQMKFIML